MSGLCQRPVAVPWQRAAGTGEVVKNRVHPKILDRTGFVVNPLFVHGTSHDDCEAENEHGGDVLDEPHDGWDDDEYELGWTEHVDQRKAVIVDQNTWNHPEGEPLLGWCENHGKGVMLCEPADDREGDDEREQPDFY